MKNTMRVTAKQGREKQQHSLKAMSPHEGSRTTRNSMSLPGRNPPGQLVDGAFVYQWFSFKG